MPAASTTAASLSCLVEDGVMSNTAEFNQLTQVMTGIRGLMGQNPTGMSTDKVLQHVLISVVDDVMVVR
jgi:hypothetical protein